MLKNSNALKRCERSQQKDHLMTACTSKVSLIVVKAENNSDYKVLVEIIFLYNSGAPAGAEGARGRSTIAIEIGNPSSRENLDVTSVRPYVRTHGLGLGTSLSLSLIWSPSLANSNTKTFFGLSRVNLLVVEIC